MKNETDTLDIEILSFKYVVCDDCGHVFFVNPDVNALCCPTCNSLNISEDRLTD